MKIIHLGDWRLLLVLLVLVLLAACGKMLTNATDILPGGDMEEGKQLFSLSCAKCHDKDAEGDGPQHSKHLPPPSNLTLTRNTADMAYSIVFEGVPGTAMPSHPYIPRGVFDKVNAFLDSRPIDTNQEWGFPWELKDPEDFRTETGRKIYVTACSGCHGILGDGKSEWADDPRIWPKPANFMARSSKPGRLYFIITTGRTGTMMAPQFEDFPAQTRWALTMYVHSFFDPDSTATIRTGERAGEKVNPHSGETDQGREVYNLYCATCHGSQGKGSFLAPRLIDRDWMYGSGMDGDVFTVIEKGIPGKLMPGFKTLPEDKRWQVIAYIRYRGGLAHPLAESY